MKLWLDDVRVMPDDYDVWCRRAEDAIAILKAGIVVEEISLDHDLGMDIMTGYDVAKFIEEAAYALKPIKWHCHSQNPGGKQRIEAAMHRADEHWAELEARIEQARDLQDTHELMTGP